MLTILNEDNIKFEDNHLLLVPDTHGNINNLSLIEYAIENGAKYKWIAIEYVLNKLESKFNKFLKTIDIENITDFDCKVCYNIFIYGKPRDSSNYSKLYAPNIEYLRKLIKVLKKFEYIVCLESNPRPSIWRDGKTDEEWWIELISKYNFTNGTVLVGAQHTNVIIYILKTNYNILCNMITVVKIPLTYEYVFKIAFTKYIDKYLTIWCNLSIVSYNRNKSRIKLR
jgi:hypothetical protein